ncbi:MAG: hypothetical protein HP477_11250 [Nitrospira sp.]|nr:hypothetical protein [Nitrospira sp.]
MALGFQVDEIVEDPRRKRPDLRASKDGTSMLVEVKTREEDAKLRAKMESVGVDATETILVPLDKHNSLSSEIEEANTQLETEATVKDLRLLWFRASSGLFVHDSRQQIGATLLGIRMIFGTRDGEEWARECVYAGYSDFFRFKSIDGAMIEVDGKLILIPNQFSPRRDAFSISPIYRAIRPAILDVQQGDHEGRFYVIDSSGVNRKDDAALLEYLRQKYPGDEFSHFGKDYSVTTVMTIDASTA